MWQERPLFPNMPILTAGASGILDVESYVDKFVQLYGTFVATVEIQGRIHPDAPWFTVASVSAPGITAIPQSFSAMRINVSAWTSGQPVAALGAMNSRVD